MPDSIDNLNNDPLETPTTPITTDNPAGDPTFPTSPTVEKTQFAASTINPNPELNANAQSAAFIPDEGPQKSKKKLIIGIVIAIVVILGIASATAFAYYYTSPEKVVQDSLQNTIKAKTVVTDGTFNVTDKTSNGSVAVQFSSQSDNEKLAGSLDAKIKIDYEDFKLDLEGAGMIAESGDLYFKIDNASELLEKSLATDYGKYYASNPALVSKLKAFVAKIDSRWIKVDKETVSEYSKDYDEQQTCTKKAIKKFYSDDKQQQQVADIYKENRFVIIKDTGKSKTINSQDSVAYDIKFSISKMETFNKKLEKTDLMKALNKCTDSTEPTEGMSSDEINDAQKEANKVKTTLWISRWSHELQKVEVGTSDKETGTMDFAINLDTKTQPKLKDPANTLDAKQLVKELEAIYTEALGAQDASASF
ncbi:MAG: hypothetical protein Q7T74_01485 [Candidatus Saccharibacteria bacterium]|nr:hypothetical protein [Candidatus Saccharibacteria bacterium]